MIMLLSQIVSLNEGGTPLRISNIGTKLNLMSLRIKDETKNPTRCWCWLAYTLGSFSVNTRGAYFDNQ